MRGRLGRLYENTSGRPGTTASDPDDWDDRGRLDRTEFYPDDRDDRERSETIIWELLSGDRDDWDDPSDPNLSQNALLFPSIRNDSDDRDDYMRTSLRSGVPIVRVVSKNLSKRLGRLGRPGRLYENQPLLIFIRLQIIKLKSPNENVLCESE